MGDIFHAGLADGEPGFCAITDVGDLTRIFDAKINAISLSREPVQAIQQYFDDTAQNGQIARGFRVRARPGAEISASLLPEDRAQGRQSLLADIRFLTEILCDLLGAPMAGVRLEVLDRPMCPRFHVDHVGIRLLCTYRGASTDYLPGKAANRACLGTAAGPDDMSSGLILDPNAIKTVAPFSILLIKGAAWQGNIAHGAIHRSPPVTPESGPRVLLAVDAIWD